MSPLRLYKRVLWLVATPAKKGQRFWGVDNLCELLLSAIFNRIKTEYGVCVTVKVRQ